MLVGCCWKKLEAPLKLIMLLPSQLSTEIICRIQSLEGCGSIYWRTAFIYFTITALGLFFSFHLKFGTHSHTDQATHELDARHGQRRSKTVSSAMSDVGRIFGWLVSGFEDNSDAKKYGTFFVFSLMRFSFAQVEIQNEFNCLRSPTACWIFLVICHEAFFSLRVSCWLLNKHSTSCWINDLKRELDVVLFEKTINFCKDNNRSFCQYPKHPVMS